MPINWKFWRRAPVDQPAGDHLPVRPSGRPAMRVNPLLLASIGPSRESAQAGTPYVLPSAVPGVIPKAAKLALDSEMSAAYSYASGDAYAEGLVFMGYPALAQLAQRPEYRRAAEIIAEEMTRKWIKIKATGEEDKTDKIAEIEAEFDRLGVQRAFREAIEQDGFFGRSQIYIDIGVSDDNELKAPLSESAAKIEKGSLKRLRVIDPTWTYPGNYNSTDPLKDDFYKPTSWYVLSREIHASRLITIIGREVPDLLKPAYAFGGLSLSQMCKPYVDNWLRTRQSVSDMLHSFNVSVLSTNMSAALGGQDATGLVDRVEMFTRFRDNRGVLVLDKETEEFTQVSAALGSLDKLQAQAQEHQAGVFGIPLVKLFGITPSGLNASSDGEMQAFYDGIAAKQERIEPHIRKMINIVQLSLHGEIDPAIGFSFEPLQSDDEATAATVRKTEADTDAVLIGQGVIDPHESRVRLAAQEGSPYAGLDLSHDPEPPGGEGGEAGADPAAGLGGLAQVADPDPQAAAQQPGGRAAPGLA